MSTAGPLAVGAAPPAPRPAGPYPRAGFYFLLLIVVAVAAFWPSYFSRLAEVDPIRHFHGIVATAWLSTLAAQGLLVRFRRRAPHRLVGRIAVFFLAPLFVASGLLVTRDMAAGANPFQAAFGPRLAFVDLVATVAFAAFVALAFRARGRVLVHARWIACTGLLLLPPALARLAPWLPGIGSFDAAYHAGFLATELVLVALLLDDHRSGQRLAPYRVLLAVTLVQHFGALLVERVPAWHAALAAIAH